MMDTALLLLIGAFIGWNLPQPFWARFVQKKVMEMLKNFGSKSE